MFSKINNLYDSIEKKKTRRFIGFSVIILGIILAVAENLVVKLSGYTLLLIILSILIYGVHFQKESDDEVKEEV